MKNLLRPSLLLALALALGVSAVLLALRSPAADGQPRVGPVPTGSREIVWMYPATNSAAWERFVTAAGTAVARIRTARTDLKNLDLELDATGAFPSQTTGLPEFSVVNRVTGERLLFRWCKLTSSSKADQWIDALTHNRPPPLAVVGGSSSESALDLARALNREKPDGRQEMLLVLTYATSEALTDVCRGRTFRFCFTNCQMARAVTQFARGRAGLQPDPERVFVAYWQDDPYSIDLTERLCKELKREADLREAVRAWTWQTGFATTGGVPLDLGGLAMHEGSYPRSERILSGVGGFSQPNRWEAEVVGRLIDHLGPNGVGRVPLVLPASSSQAARRFLRSLVRSAPIQARRFVVLTGDVISFNVVYRDRDAAWPIQDVPFDLVFFCHRNPISGTEGFSPETPSATGRDGAPLRTTGTDELLLAVDIMEALLQAAFANGKLVDGPEQMREWLKDARWEPYGNDGRVGVQRDGVQFFSDNGNRQNGTGEHVVWLVPQFEGNRVLPRSRIEVWAWQGETRQDRRWTPASNSPLSVAYERFDWE